MKWAGFGGALFIVALVLLSGLAAMLAVWVALFMFLAERYGEWQAAGIVALIAFGLFLLTVAVLIWQGRKLVRRWRLQAASGGSLGARLQQIPGLKSVMSTVVTLVAGVVVARNPKLGAVLFAVLPRLFGSGRRRA